MDCEAASNALTVISITLKGPNTLDSSLVAITREHSVIKFCQPIRHIEAGETGHLSGARHHSSFDGMLRWFHVELDFGSGWPEQSGGRDHVRNKSAQSW